jgi:hypothetical protein
MRLTDSATVGRKRSGRDRCLAPLCPAFVNRTFRRLTLPRLVVLRQLCELFRQQIAREGRIDIVDLTLRETRKLYPVDTAFQRFCNPYTHL